MIEWFLFMISGEALHIKSWYFILFSLVIIDFCLSWFAYVQYGTHKIWLIFSKIGTADTHNSLMVHDDVIKWKHFLRYWPFVQGIHQSPVNSPHKGLWRGALMFSLICTWINGWVNKREAGDLRCHHAHYDVTVLWLDTGCLSLASGVI